MLEKYLKDSFFLEFSIVISNNLLLFCEGTTDGAEG